MKIFLDANILFSAALPQSAMRRFLEVLFTRTKCLTNAYAIEEARRIIAAKFPTRTKALDELVARCIIIPQFPVDLKAKVALQDVPILGGAIAGHATHLLTGDERDFGEFWGHTIQGVKIVSPKMLAEEMRLG